MMPIAVRIMPAMRGGYLEVLPLPNLPLSNEIAFVSSKETSCHYSYQHHCGESTVTVECRHDLFPNTSTFSPKAPHVLDSDIVKGY